MHAAARLVPALILLGFAGCAQPDAREVPSPADECFRDSPPQVQDVEVDAYYAHTPDGGSMGSDTLAEFSLSGDRAKLARLGITLTWDPVVPLHDRLRFDLPGKDHLSPFQRFEGPSPLHGEFEVTPESPIGEMVKLSLGTVTDNGPLPVSVTPVPQPVSITLQETYHC